MGFSLKKTLKGVGNFIGGAAKGVVNTVKKVASPVLKGVGSLGVPLISGAANVANALITSNSNKKAVQQTNNSQMDLAQYQADQNLNLWNLNNEYNTPAAQMQRYQDAGLNPNLIYGSSGSAGNSSSPADGYSAPTLHAPQFDYSPVASAAQLMLNGLSQQSDIAYKNAKTQEVYQNIANLKVDNSLKHLHEIAMQYSNSKSKVESDMWFDLYQAKLADLDSRAILSRSTAELNDSRRFSNDAMRPLELDLMRNKVRIALSDANYRGRLNESQLLKIAADIEYLGSRYKGQELENKITEVLIDKGVDLRGDSLERFLYNTLGPDSASFGWLNGVAGFAGRAALKLIK